MANNKNLKKNSKPTQVAWEKKERKKKQEILFEITKEIYDEMKQQGDLSYFKGNKVDRIVSRYGKQYVVVLRER